MIDLRHHKGYLCVCVCWVVPRDGVPTCLNCSFKRNTQIEGPAYSGSDIDQRMIKAGECRVVAATRSESHRDLGLSFTYHRMANGSGR